MLIPIFNTKHDITELCVHALSTNGLMSDDVIVLETNHRQCDDATVHP